MRGAERDQAHSRSRPASQSNAESTHVNILLQVSALPGGYTTLSPSPPLSIHVFRQAGRSIAFVAR